MFTLKEVLVKKAVEEQPAFESKDANDVLLAAIELGKELATIANEEMPNELMEEASDAMRILAVVETTESGFESEDDDVVEAVRGVLNELAKKYNVEGFEEDDKKTVMDKAKAAVKAVIDAIKAFFVGLIERGKNLFNGLDAFTPILNKKINAIVEKWEDVKKGAEKITNKDINSGTPGAILVAGNGNVRNVAKTIESYAQALAAKDVKGAFDKIVPISLHTLDVKSKEFDVSKAKLIAIGKDKLVYLVLDNDKLDLKSVNLKDQGIVADIQIKLMDALRKNLQNADAVKELKAPLEMAKAAIKERNKAASEYTKKLDKSSAEYLKYIKEVKIPLMKASDKTIASAYGIVKAEIELFDKIAKIGAKKEEGEE